MLYSYFYHQYLFEPKYTQKDMEFTTKRLLGNITFFIIDFRKNPSLLIEVRKLFLGKHISCNHLGTE